MSAAGALLAIMGPTASGKTRLAVELAQALDGEIISCDSVQIYRGLDIGSAKPDEEERGGVSHHLLDILDPSDRYSVAQFKQAATGLVTEIHARGRLPILAGGTMLYMRALIHNYPLNRVPPNDALRQQLYQKEERQPGSLHQQLEERDPASAAKIHPHDTKRLVRALEIIHTTGQAASEINNDERQSPYTCFKLGLKWPRLSLYQRINQRVDAMMEMGLVEEVRALLASWGSDAPALESLGYSEITAYLQETHSLEEAIRLIKRNTRHFAKKQLSWLRRENDVFWIDAQVAASEQRAQSLRYLLVNGLQVDNFKLT